MSAGARPGPRGLTTRSTRPNFLAFLPLTVLPVKHMSRAVGRPTNLGILWVPPLPGRRPSITSGKARLVLKPE